MAGHIGIYLFFFRIFNRRGGFSGYNQIIHRGSNGRGVHLFPNLPLGGPFHPSCQSERASDFNTVLCFYLFFGFLRILPHQQKKEQRQPVSGRRRMTTTEPSSFPNWLCAFSISSPQFRLAPGGSIFGIASSGRKGSGLSEYGLAVSFYLSFMCFFGFPCVFTIRGTRSNAPWTGRKFRGREKNQGFLGCRLSFFFSSFSLHFFSGI